jgi:hypothetical protein
MNNKKRKIIFSFQVYSEDPQHLNTVFDEKDDFEDGYPIRVRGLEDEIRSLFVSPLAGSNDEYLENKVHAASTSIEIDWMAMMYT